MYYKNLHILANIMTGLKWNVLNIFQPGLSEKEQLSSSPLEALVQADNRGQAQKDITRVAIWHTELRSYGNKCSRQPYRDTEKKREKQERKRY